MSSAPSASVEGLALRDTLKRLLAATRQRRLLDIILTFVLSVAVFATLAHALEPSGSRSNKTVTVRAAAPIPPNSVVFAPLSAGRDALAAAVKRSELAGFTGRWNNDADSKTLQSLRKNGAAGLPAVMNLSNEGDLLVDLPDRPAPCTDAAAAGAVGLLIGQRARAGGYNFVLGPAVNHCPEGKKPSAGVLRAFQSALSQSGVHPIFRGYSEPPPVPSLQTQMYSVEPLAVTRSNLPGTDASPEQLRAFSPQALLMSDVAHRDDGTRTPQNAVTLIKLGADALLYEDGMTGWRTATRSLDELAQQESVFRTQLAAAIRRVQTLLRQ